MASHTEQPDLMPHIIHAIMTKRSRQRNFTLTATWKERLFILDADRMKLAYYTIPNVSCDWTKVDPPVGTKKGEVSLVNCRVSIVPEAMAERVFMFQVSTAEGDLYISAPTKSVREKWVRHIHLISQIAALQQSTRRPKLGDKYFKYRTRRLVDRVLYPEFVAPSEGESFAWENDSDTSDLLAQTLINIAHCNAATVEGVAASTAKRGGMQVHINHGMQSSVKPELELSWNMYNEKRRLEDA